MRKFLYGIFVLIILVSFVGCSQATQPTSETTDPNKNTTPPPIKDKNELRVAMSVAPPTLDMHKTTAVVTQQVGWHIFEFLVTLDKDYKVVPMLAEKIEISGDGKTITLPLRKGVTFHNGKAMTAQDVVASLNRWKQMSSTGRSALSKTTVTAKDEMTVQLSLEQPSSTVLPALAYPVQGAVIMPKEVIEGADEVGVKEYIGTGPFQFAEWKQDQYIHLKKFAGYQSLSEPTSGLAGKKEAKVDDLYFIPVPDAATRLAGLQTGEYDFADEIPFDNYDIVKNDPNLTSYVTKPRRYNGFIFNTKAGVFSNAKIRQAVNAALDMDSIMMAATGNPDFYRLDHGLMHQEQAWYVDSGKEQYNQKNESKAKELLKEAGYKGEPVTILGSKDYEFLYKGTLVIASQLEKIGMKVNLEIYDWPTLISKRGKEEGWNAFLSYFPLFAEPTQTIFLDSRNNWPVPGSYHNPKMLMLLDQMRATSDFEEGKKIFTDVQALYWEDVPVIKIGDMYGLIAMRNYVKDYQFFMDISFWNVAVQ
ncbi:ABC transporter substrate-binding protein [Brevibacillus invocatus]|uniref:ABC transporter substrate-binding protein n=1 Tax=Brevibacillus invocatus TaxID=173959 RepID=UPI00204104D0|nr:ABC transporter substrate-binding protein [Brevibacillus invocatus]MCM3082051.1 ABC transporter substrate-binding protein [Brevibacillus invocatus]MCM3432462.1 ABC transporter substrate-binding protein [Brevibacillus invocatus]